VNRDDRGLRYRVKESPGAHRLTVLNPSADPLAEETIIEGLVFESIPALLHFVGVHFPNAKEVFE